MPSKVDDLATEPPTNINPYETLGLKISASAEDIKKTYKKLALKHHPDKAIPQNRTAAHSTFQEIAFAYAILSDERRRKRYDSSGNTSDSLDLDGEDFNWSDFFREQWADAVTVESLNTLKSTYQGSDDEKRDVLRVYKSSKGNLNSLFQTVMLSNPLDDEERFCGYIDEAIANDDVEAYEAYTNEPTRKREHRRENAKLEGKEAADYAKKLGVYEELFEGRRKKGTIDDESRLAALIQQKSKGRAAKFLDNLEARYASGAKNTKKGKKRLENEPPEEAFENTAARAKKRKSDEKKPKDDERQRELEENDKRDELDNTKTTRKQSRRARK